MPSKLEEQFVALWEYHFPDIDLHSEVCLIPGRKFRFDFVHHPTKVAIEINGQIWRKGGHSSGSGLIRDYTKLNLAAFEGWQVLQLSSEHLTEEWIKKIGNYIINRGLFFAEYYRAVCDFKTMEDCLKS